MPVIDITIPQGALSAEAKKELPAVLGRIAIGYEGLSGSVFAEEFTWVYIHELPAMNVTQVSGTPPKPIYRLVFTTLVTLLDDDSKQRLGTDVARAIYEMEGTPWDEGEAYNRVWTFFDDVRQGDWIVGARVNTIRALRAEVEKERAAAEKQNLVN